MPKLGWGSGQRQTAINQAKNAPSALGDREAFGTVLFTWGAGIAIGVLLVVAIAGFSLLDDGGTSRVEAAARSTSDRTTTEKIGNRPIAERETIAQQGYQLFVQKGCQGCHQQGGYGIAGQGPRLQYSGNARDSTYVHSIVRWGYAPMPAYPAVESETATAPVISNDELYRIIVYLQYIQDNRETRPAWVR